MTLACITRNAWERLRTAKEVYLRTREHPTVFDLPEGPTYHSFDSVYDDAESFSAVYKTIVSRLLEATEKGDVVYAVPGDPTVAEGTVTRLQEQATSQVIDIEIIHGVSCIEPVLAAVRC